MFEFYSRCQQHTVKALWINARIGVMQGDGRSVADKAKHLRPIGEVERLQFIYRLGGDGREYGPHIEDGYGEGRCPIIGNWFLATLGQI